MILPDKGEDRASPNSVYGALKGIGDYRNREDERTLLGSDALSNSVHNVAILEVLLLAATAVRLFAMSEPKDM